MMRWMCLTSVLWVVVACGNSEPTPAATPKQEPAHEEAGDEAAYECPMKCVVEGEDAPHHQAEPGQCPVCGMDLVKKK